MIASCILRMGGETSPAMPHRAPSTRSSRVPCPRIRLGRERGLLCEKGRCMRYFAEWNAVSGDVTVSEQSDEQEPETIHSDTIAELSGAAQMVKDWGFDFTDMWTTGRGGWVYKAPLKAVERDSP